MFVIFCQVVVLDQDHLVFVDGYIRNLPVNTDNMLIRRRGRKIVCLLYIGLHTRDMEERYYVSCIIYI